MKIRSVDTTPSHASKGSKTISYFANDVKVAVHTQFLMGPSRLFPNRTSATGRTFHWLHDGLKQVLCSKYETHQHLFENPRIDLVFGKGATIPFKKVKEILNSI